MRIKHIAGEKVKNVKNMALPFWLYHKFGIFKCVKCDSMQSFQNDDLDFEIKNLKLSDFDSEGDLICYNCYRDANQLKLISIYQVI